MAPDAAECCAISHHSRAARQSPRGCGGGSCAPSCAVGGTAQSAGPAQPIAHRSKRHNQFHLSWSQYWDRHQELTGPSTTVAYRPCTALTYYILWLSSALSTKCAVLIHCATVVLAADSSRA